MPDLQPLEIDVLLHKPIPLNIRAEDGTIETIEFPRLGVDGLLPWLDELTAERYKAYMAEIEAANIKDPRTIIEAKYAARVNTKAVVVDLNGPVQTADGSRRVLKMSLAMTDLPKDKQATIISQVTKSADVAYTLACRLSTLFSMNEQRPERTNPTASVMQVAKAAFPGMNPMPGQTGGDAAGPLDVAESGPNTPDPATISTG